MMYRRFLAMLGVALGVVVFVGTAYAANVFTETFNSLTAGTAIATNNTGFDYVRIGTGGGSITAEQATSGEIHMRLGGSSSTSLNGVGIQSSLGGLDVVTLNFRMRLEDTLGDIFIGMGQGTMFTGNGTFATNDLMWGIQSDNGNLERRVGSSWLDIGPTTLNVGENYDFHIVVNRSGATINYGVHSVADGTMDLFLNGSLIGDDLAIANNQNAAGFRIYQVSGSSYARIDSITIDDTALEPFTPTAVTLSSFSPSNTNLPLLLLVVFGLLVGGTAVVAHRRKA